MQKHPDGPWLRLDQPLASFVRHNHGAGLVVAIRCSRTISGEDQVKTVYVRKETRNKRAKNHHQDVDLLDVDYFTSRLEVSPLKDRTTGYQWGGSRPAGPGGWS